MRAAPSTHPWVPRQHAALTPRRLPQEDKGKDGTPRAKLTMLRLRSEVDSAKLKELIEKHVPM